MNKITAVGTYCRDGKYGVWTQIRLPVGNRHVLVEIEITPPVMKQREADTFAKKIHDVSDKRQVERLTFGTDFITRTEELIG